MKRFVFFIALSLLLHFLSWDLNSRLTHWLGLDAKLQSKSTSTIEVSLESPDENKEDKSQIAMQPLVRYTDPPKELLDLSAESLKKKADFSSDRIQRVLQESKASEYGKTQNRASSKSKTPSPEKSLSQHPKINPMLNPHKLTLKDLSKKTKTEHFTEKDRDAAVAENSKQQNEAFAKPANPLLNSPSTIGEMISDKVKVGDFTALNTDRNLYYSFFTRIEDSVRSQWESGVEDTLSMLHRTNIHINQKAFKTRIDILLTKDGHFFKAVLLKSSGVHGLDQAIVNAFKEAQFFPHPPTEMIGSDGYIKLEYLFHVDYIPPNYSTTHLQR